jgi:hypothetical protein
MTVSKHKKKQKHIGEIRLLCTEDREVTKHDVFDRHTRQNRYVVVCQACGNSFSIAGYKLGLTSDLPLPGENNNPGSHFL